MGGFFEYLSSFLNHPVTLALGGFAVFCLVVLWGLNNVRVGKPKPWRPTDTPWLNAVFAAAIGLSPILTILFVAVLAMLVMVGWHIFASGMIANDPDNLRWYVLSFVALLTALGGIIGTPLAIIRIWNSERQTSTQEEALFNEKINAAALDLAARRQVTRIVGHGANQRVLTEWQDDLVSRNAAINRLQGLANERSDSAPRIASLLSVYVVELSAEHPAQVAPKGASPIALRNWAEKLDDKRSDMEKAAQTLGRLLDIDGNDMPGATIDLRDAILQGFDLRDLSFKAARLRDAHLERTNLWGAHLEGADLWGAHLEGADLRGAHLEGADLRDAHLEGAYLGDAHLEGANLGDAHLEGADLWGAHLEGADLRDAHLEGADLWGAHLEGAYLGDAHLEGANLGGAHLDEKTSLPAASLRGAAGRDVDWSTVNISQYQVNSMFGDASVELHRDLKRPVHWPDTKLDWQEFDNEYRKWLANPASYLPPQNRS
jgi:uncharacterized protein YjbI with pentapeptide repeats